MLKKEAKAITGGLSAPSKMPGPAYNLPAPECITGAKLVQIPGSVCAGCYALKGRYNFRNVRLALARRLESLKHPRWVQAMTVLIKGEPHFRWHDSGDLQSHAHLNRIFQVCDRTPETSHWMPTREAQFIKDIPPDKIPTNLIIRMSSHMIDQGPVTFWPWTSTVQSPGAMRTSHVQDSRQCPAQNQGNKCLDCRACWDREVPNVTYPKH